MYIPEIPDNSLKNEITQIVKIAVALEGMEHFAFYPPASEQEFQELEDYFETAFPESYKDWMRFSNGAEIAGNYVTIFRTSEISKYQIKSLRDDYIVIGTLVGDGELLCISKTSGQFIRWFEGKETYYDTLNDFFKRPLKRMLLNAEEMVGEI